MSVADGRAADAPPRAMLQSVQVMRGVAAMAVAFYHTHLFLAKPALGGNEVFGSLATYGWTGVNFFFVLSGFIILLAHAGDIGRPARAATYSWRRFVRVYPIYWVFLTAYIAAAALGYGEPEFSWTHRNLLGAYLLVQIDGAPPTLPLKVAWTLFYEITFYAAFFFLIVNRLLGSLVISGWITAILVNAFIWQFAPDSWYVHVWSLYFVAGAVAYGAYTRMNPRYGSVIFAAGLLGLVLAAALGFIDHRIAVFQERRGPLLVMALPFAMVLLGGALWDQRRQWRAPGLLLLLGDATYSIYLTHSAAISVIAPQLHKHHGFGLPSAIQFLLVVAVAIAGGMGAHLLVERPLLRALRNVPGGRGARARQPSRVSP